mgnify:CR=1 FL=1
MSLINTTLLGVAFKQDPNPLWEKIDGVALGDTFNYKTVNSTDIGKILSNADDNTVTVVYDWKGIGYIKNGFNLLDTNDYKLIKGYTTKQWGRDPKELPSSIIRRLPIRLTYDENYFFDKYQGIPIGGYTKMIENIQGNIPVEFGVDFLKDREYWEGKADKIVFTGPIDEFFDYSEGVLEYRSLDFETEVLDIEDYQGNAIVNYTESKIPWTRICEHKHFDWTKSEKTIITKEYPAEWKPGKERFYPVSDEKNKKIYSSYKELSLQISDKYIFGGRLAEYKYYDMHHVIGSALARSKKEISITR